MPSSDNIMVNETGSVQVAAGSVYVHARDQRLTQTPGQITPPASVQYAAVVAAISAVTCAAACVLAVMPASTHVPLVGVLQWAVVARGAIIWGLLIAPLIILMLARLQRAYAHAHVLQTAGVFLLSVFLWHVLVSRSFDGVWMVCNLDLQHYTPVL
jgi:hypothetical protein